MTLYERDILWGDIRSDLEDIIVEGEEALARALYTYFVSEDGTSDLENTNKIFRVITCVFIPVVHAIQHMDGKNGHFEKILKFLGSNDNCEKAITRFLKMLK